METSVIMNNTVHLTSTANVLYLCRLCGTETISQDKLLHIFDANGVALNIRLKIINCLGFDVNENDYLPKILCSDCVDNLEKFNEFKVKSNKTALYLIDLLTKQVSAYNKEPLKRAVNYQERNLDSKIFEPYVHIKINNSNSNNPITEVQIQPLQLSNNYIPNPSIDSKVIPLQFNTWDVFPNSAQPIEQVNIDQKSTNNNEAQIQSNVKKSKNKKVNKIEILKDYKCDHCSKVWTIRRKFVSHLATHSDIKYDCTICGMKLKTKSSLSMHIKLHNKEYKYVCNYCGKCFMIQPALETHIRTTHTKEYPFQCTKCIKKFPSKGSLKSHMYYVHNDERNFICQICNKSFKSKKRLEHHENMHKPKEERLKYKCHICDASFIFSCGYKRHIRKHTGELKYECKFCEKRYIDNSGLKVHLLTHTGEKNHICDFCGKAFALSENLKDHRRIHTGERPFKCECEKTFTQRSALNRHKKTCSKDKKQNKKQ